MIDKIISFFKAAIDFIRKYWTIIFACLSLFKELSKLSKTDLDDKAIAMLEKYLSKIKPE